MFRCTRLRQRRVRDLRLETRDSLDAESILSKALTRMRARRVERARYLLTQQASKPGAAKGRFLFLAPSIHPVCFPSGYALGGNRHRRAVCAVATPTEYHYQAYYCPHYLRSTDPTLPCSPCDCITATLLDSHEDAMYVVEWREMAACCVALEICTGTVKMQ